MKLQAITMIAVISGIFTTSNADAGKFNLGDAIRTAQQIDRVVNGPQYGGGKPVYKPLPYPGPKPLPHPGHGGGKPPVFTPPVHKPHPPVCRPKPPIHKPLPHPGHGHPPVCKKPPVCKPPINRPPVKCYTMKLINDAGAEVFFSLNGDDYQQLDTGDVEMVKSHSPKPHLISYHNGFEVVEFELDPAAVYGFEWQGDTLMLLEIQG